MLKKNLKNLKPLDVLCLMTKHNVTFDQEVEEYFLPENDYLKIRQDVYKSLLKYSKSGNKKSFNKAVNATNKLLQNYVQRLQYRNDVCHHIMSVFAEITKNIQGVYFLLDRSEDDDNKD